MMKMVKIKRNDCRIERMIKWMSRMKLRMIFLDSTLLMKIIKPQQ